MTLEVLLKEAITEPAKRSLFLQTLIRSDVFVMCNEPVKDEGNGIKLKLKTITDPTKRTFIPFFTSYKELLRFSQRYVEHYKINCLRLFDLIQSQNTVINPNYYSKEFSSSEIQQIVKISRSMNIPQITMNQTDTVVYSHATGDYNNFKNSTIRILQKHDNVNQAFLLHLQREDGKTQLLLVLDIIGNAGRLFKEIAKPIVSILKRTHENLWLSFVTTENIKIRKAIKNEVPFYVRKKKL
jgi:hypothetical protein